MLKQKLLVIGVLVLVSSFCLAAERAGASFEPRPYVGVGYATTEVDGVAGLNVSSDDNGFRLFGGYELTNNFGVEVGYTDFGSGNGSFLVTGTTLTATFTGEASGFYVAAVGRLPINDKFSLIGKLGIMRWAAEGSASLNGFLVQTYDESGFDPTYGVGASYSITNKIDVLFDIATYSGVADGDASHASFGVKFNL